jgi:TRAP-type C4-dicarboxylate transport system permease small subunit
MPAIPKAHPLPRWYLVPVRVLILTFLFALVAFALSLLLGIIGVVIRGRVGGIHPNLAVAYRYVALPVALVMASVVLITVTVLEIRRYRQVKALRQIEEASR